MFKIVYSLLLCILLCLGQWRSTNAQENATAPAPAPADDTTGLKYWNKPRITVCTSEWTPMVFCANKTAAQYTGFEIEFFRQVASKLGWDSDLMDWKCMGWDDMMTDIVDWKGTNGNGTCDLAVAGFAAKPGLDRMGLTFTWPSTRVGKRLLVEAQKEAPGGWFFLSALSTEIWILLFVSSVITGVLTWLIEVGCEALNADTRWMSNVMWDTIGRPVQMRDYRLSSNPANLVAFVWSFAVFIIMAMYTANLTANLTTSSVTSSITALSDLPGKSVGTWEGYSDDLLKYNIKAKTYPWNDIPDEQAMLDALHNGFISALVMESSWVSVTDAVDCNTLIVGGIFDGVDVVAAFPTGFNNTELLEAYNRAVINVLADGWAERLTARFIEVQQAPCKVSEISLISTLQVEWSQVYGLWICLGVAVGVAAFFVGFRWIWKRYSNNFSWVSKTGNHLDKINNKIVHVGTGRFSKRTPKSAQPRTIEFKTGMTFNERNDELWVDNYAGASAGYLEGSADARKMEAKLKASSDVEKPPSDDSEGRSATFESAILAELAVMRQSLAQLQRQQMIIASTTGNGAPLASEMQRGGRSFAVHFGDQDAN